MVRPDIADNRSSRRPPHPKPVRAICIGEGMLELRLQGTGLQEIETSTGGDALNTAAHMARLGVETGFCTAVGTDGLSGRLLEQWRNLGIDCTTVVQIPGATPGVYAIELGEGGERRFQYWRSHSAARQLWTDPTCGDAIARSGQAELVYLTGVTLSLTDDDGRERISAFLRKFRSAGGRVAFDLNYRPAGWPGRDAASRAIMTALSHADIALPSSEDAAALFDTVDAAGIAEIIAGADCPEIVVKDGARGCMVFENSEGFAVPVQTVLVPVDTTGAGDAFNAGYLAARLEGLGAKVAARNGNAVAAQAVMHHGAIPI